MALTVGLCELMDSTLVTIFSTRGGYTRILGGLRCINGKLIRAYLVIVETFGFYYIIAMCHVY